MVSSHGKKAPSTNTKNYKTQLCRQWLTGVPCEYGKLCQFAHGPEELLVPEQHSKYKTELCNKLPDCKFGEKCHYIHPEDLLKDPKCLTQSRDDYYLQKFGMDARAGGQTDSIDFFAEPPREPSPTLSSDEEEVQTVPTQWSDALATGKLCDRSPEVKTWLKLRLAMLIEAELADFRAALALEDAVVPETYSSSDSGYNSTSSTPRRGSLCRDADVDWSSDDCQDHDVLRFDRDFPSSWPELDVILAVIAQQSMETIVSTLLNE